MKKLTTIEILQGWRSFLSDHGVHADKYDTLYIFGVHIAIGVDYNRSLGFLVDSALNSVAQETRGTCLRHGVPLWPALIPQSAIHNSQFGKAVA